MITYLLMLASFWLWVMWKYRKRKQKPKRKTHASRNNRIYIYALVDKGVIFSKYFYVGRTNNPDRRLREHIASANRYGRAVQKYIHHMRREPTMKILASTTNETKARKLERKYVERYGFTNTLLKR